MICENGLVIATTQFESHKVRHMGYDFEALQEVIKLLVEKLPLTVDSMNKMKSTELSAEQTFEFATALLEERVKGTNNTFTEVAVANVLQTQRSQDEGYGLWEVFNRVQENIVEGNFQYITPKGKFRQARPIKNFKQDMQLNQNLYERALEFVA